MVGGCALILADSDTNNSNDVLGDDHSTSTEDQEITATNTLDHVEWKWGWAYVDQGGDQADEERIFDSVKTAKSSLLVSVSKLSSIIENSNERINPNVKILAITRMY